LIEKISLAQYKAQLSVVASNVADAIQYLNVIDEGLAMYLDSSWDRLYSMSLGLVDPLDAVISDIEK
jgi:hypothetical protein